MSSISPRFQSLRLARAIIWATACFAALTIGFDRVRTESSHPDLVTIHKRLREEACNRTYAVREKNEQWKPNQAAIIVCDVWVSPG